MNGISKIGASDSLLWTIVTSLIGFAISFGIVYWIGTKDLGLCFVIALAMAGSASAAKQEVLSFGKNLYPIFVSLDDNINGLISEKERLEQELEEINDKIKDLDSRLENLEA